MRRDNGLTGRKVFKPRPQAIGDGSSPSRKKITQAPELELPALVAEQGSLEPALDGADVF